MYFYNICGCYLKPANIQINPHYTCMHMNIIKCNTSTLKAYYIFFRLKLIFYKQLSVSFLRIIPNDHDLILFTLVKAFQFSCMTNVMTFMAMSLILIYYVYKRITVSPGYVVSISFIVIKVISQIKHSRSQH